MSVFLTDETSGPFTVSSTSVHRPLTITLNHCTSCASKDSWQIPDGASSPRSLPFDTHLESRPGVPKACHPVFRAAGQAVPHPGPVPTQGEGDSPLVGQIRNTLARLSTSSRPLPQNPQPSRTCLQTSACGTVVIMLIYGGTTGTEIPSALPRTREPLSSFVHAGTSSGSHTTDRHRNEYFTELDGQSSRHLPRTLDGTSQEHFQSPLNTSQ